MFFLKKMFLLVGFKLGVSFSPLHTDCDHPVENEEAGARHRVERYKGAGSEGQVHLIR